MEIMKYKYSNHCSSVLFLGQFDFFLVIMNNSLPFLVDAVTEAHLARPAFALALLGVIFSLSVIIMGFCYCLRCHPRAWRTVDRMEARMITITNTLFRPQRTEGNLSQSPLISFPPSDHTYEDLDQVGAVADDAVDVAEEGGADVGDAGRAKGPGYGNLKSAQYNVREDSLKFAFSGTESLRHPREQEPRRGAGRDGVDAGRAGGGRACRGQAARRERGQDKAGGRGPEV